MELTDASMKTFRPSITDIKHVAHRDANQSFRRRAVAPTNAKSAVISLLDDRTGMNLRARGMQRLSNICKLVRVYRKIPSKHHARCCEGIDPIPFLILEYLNQSIVRIGCRTPAFHELRT